MRNLYPKEVLGHSGYANAPLLTRYVNKEIRFHGEQYKEGIVGMQCFSEHT